MENKDKKSQRQRGLRMKRLWANKMIAITILMTLILIPTLILLWWYMSTLYYVRGNPLLRQSIARRDGLR